MLWYVHPCKTPVVDRPYGTEPRQSDNENPFAHEKLIAAQPEPMDKKCEKAR
jgi:hypothetical protein